MSTSYNPYFIDANGNEVHLGDMVSWVVNTAGNTTRSKTSKVLSINFNLDSNDNVFCTVKVKGRGQNIAAYNVTLINQDTLSGKLRHLVAASDGRIDEDVIAAAATEIESYFSDDSEDTETESTEAESSETESGETE